MSENTVEVKKNRFASYKVTKSIKFLGQSIDIQKLSVSQVLGIQERAKELEVDPSEEGNLGMLYLVCKMGAKELEDLDDSEFREFPMDELSSLSAEILKFSGLSQKDK
jgi:hypothetical protein